MAGYADDAARIVHMSRQGEHEKRLLNDGYACLELRVMDDGKSVARLVTQREAQRKGFFPAPAGVVRLFKGDTVLDKRDNRTYRIGYFTAEGNIFVIPYADTRNFDAIKEPGSGKKKVSFGQAKNLVLIA